MKYLKLLLAALVLMLFVEAAGADQGAAYYLLRTFGDYKELVLAALIGWLIYPMLDEAS